MGRQWAHYIWPRLRGVDFTLVVDVACGHGRNTAQLARRSGRVVAVDINHECVEVTRRRFAHRANVEVRVGDGTSLPGVRDGEATLIYCWDAMVHFAPEVVAAYVADFARALAPGGVGFIHHSNWTGGKDKDFRSQPHWRNFMSREIFGSFLRANQLEILSQDVVSWDTSQPFWYGYFGLQRAKRPVPALDCISMFRRPRK
jgi:ubiquinone/menaquinone biosynthesis C-methylase UbiE